MVQYIAHGLTACKGGSGSWQLMRGRDPDGPDAWLELRFGYGALDGIGGSFNRAATVLYGVSFHT
jgi:hypothetical protein